MSGRHFSLSGVVIAVAISTGCSGPDHPPALLLREAARANRTGEDAYLRGDAARAVPALQEAVQLHLAAGDLPGAVTALVNLALAQRTGGETTAVRATVAHLSELLAPACQQAASDRERNDLTAQSVWIEGLVALDAGEVDSAQAAADRAPAVSGTTSDRWQARLETLRGAIALRQNRPGDAVVHARAAQSAAHRAVDRAEEAHALRIDGAAHLALAQWIEARTDFLAAVTIEEELGAGTRMAGDLENLAVAADQLGDHENARLYRLRAQAIQSAR